MCFYFASQNNLSLLEGYFYGLIAYARNGDKLCFLMCCSVHTLLTAGALMIIPPVLTVIVPVVRNITVKANCFCYELIKQLKMISREEAQSVIPT